MAAKKKRAQSESPLAFLADVKLPPRTKKTIPIPKKPQRCSKCGKLIEPADMMVTSTRIGRIYSESMQKMLKALHFEGDPQYLCHKVRDGYRSGQWEYRTCGPLVENTAQADFIDWIAGPRPTSRR